MSSDPNMSPVNPVPPVVVAMFILILLIEAAFTLGNQGLVGGPAAVGWRSAAVQSYGFNGAVFDWMVQNNRWPAEHLLRFVSYLFIHASFTHALVAGVMLLALGKFVGDVFAWWAVLVVVLGSGAGGAAVWGLVLDDPRYLMGAFPAVYGLIGAFSFVLWVRLGQSGDNQMRAFALIAVLMAIQLIFGVLFGGSTDWLADLAGFVIGFLLSFVVSPGGWAALRARLRRP